MKQEVSHFIDEETVERGIQSDVRQLCVTSVFVQLLDSHAESHLDQDSFSEACEMYSRRTVFLKGLSGMPTTSCPHF
ncbi:MAG: hypothetical protein U0236_13900 [Nitrospira sp.]